MRLAKLCGGLPEMRWNRFALVDSIRSPSTELLLNCFYCGGIVDVVEDVQPVSVLPAAAGERLRIKSLQKGDVVIRIDPRYFRPTEVESLLGDPGKAKRELGWEPRISFAELVKEMVLSDLEAAKRDALVEKHGFKSFSYHE